MRNFYTTKPFIHFLIRAQNSKHHRFQAPSPTVLFSSLADSSFLTLCSRALSFPLLISLRKNKLNYFRFKPSRRQLRHTDPLHSPNADGSTRGRHTERRWRSTVAHHGQHEGSDFPRTRETNQVFEREQNSSVAGHRFRRPQRSRLGPEHVRFGGEIHVSYVSTITIVVVLTLTLNKRTFRKPKLNINS